MSRIIYFSRSALDRNVVTATDQKAQLVRSSRRRNEFGLISSIILLEGGYFTQVLEGDRSALHDTFQRIAADPRHKDVRILEWRDVTRRDLVTSCELVERTPKIAPLLDEASLPALYRSGFPKAQTLATLVAKLSNQMLSERGAEVLM